MKNFHHNEKNNEDFSSYRILIEYLIGIDKVNDKPDDISEGRITEYSIHLFIITDRRLNLPICPREIRSPR